MGYFYSGTCPSRAEALLTVSIMRHLPPGEDRVREALTRRLDAAKARRLAAALSEGTPEDQAVWTREKTREERLTRALREWMARSF